MLLPFGPAASHLECVGNIMLMLSPSPYPLNPGDSAALTPCRHPTIRLVTVCGCLYPVLVLFVSAKGTRTSLIGIPSARRWKRVVLWIAHTALHQKSFMSWRNTFVCLIRWWCVRDESPTSRDFGVPGETQGMLIVS